MRSCARSRQKRTERKRGYELEKAYGFRDQALKNYYLLVQIAHCLHQLMMHSGALRVSAKNCPPSPLTIHGPSATVTLQSWGIRPLDLPNGARNLIVTVAVIVLLRDPCDGTV